MSASRAKLSPASGTVGPMRDLAPTDGAALMMISGVALDCPDCAMVTIFVPVDEECTDRCAFCCTSCGAAMLVDPLLELPETAAPDTALVSAGVA